MSEVHILTRFSGPEVALQDVSVGAARGRLAGLDVVEQSLEERRRIGGRPERAPCTRT